MAGYILMKFDSPLIRFDLSTDEFAQTRITYTVLIGDPAGLPDGLVCTENSLFHWLSRRVIPRNRMFSNTVLSGLGLAEHDLIGLIRTGKLLSVNDPYWVVEESFSGSWAEWNLYENPFSTQIARIALTGQKETILESSISPELTTNGQLPKMWKREDGRLLLLKGSGDTRPFPDGGKEPFSEFYVSQILEDLGIRHVRYDLRLYEGTLVSVCENFTSPSVSYVSMGRIVKSPYLRDLSAFLLEAGALEDFADLVFADALVLNEDRHFGNFGMLKNNHTNEWIGLAPLFDHGLSLFARLTDDRMDDATQFDGYSRDNAMSAIGASHQQLVSLFCSRRHRELLRKMIGFHFVRHSLYNLDEMRLVRIEQWLHERATEMLGRIERE